MCNVVVALRVVGPGLFNTNGMSCETERCLFSVQCTLGVSTDKHPICYITPQSEGVDISTRLIAFSIIFEMWHKSYICAKNIQNIIFWCWQIFRSVYSFYFLNKNCLDFINFFWFTNLMPITYHIVQPSFLLDRYHLIWAPSRTRQRRYL